MRRTRKEAPRDELGARFGEADCSLTLSFDAANTRRPREHLPHTRLAAGQQYHDGGPAPTTQNGVPDLRAAAHLGEQERDNHQIGRFSFSKLELTKGRDSSGGRDRDDSERRSSGAEEDIRPDHARHSPGRIAGRSLRTRIVPQGDSTQYWVQYRFVAEEIARETPPCGPRRHFVRSAECPRIARTSPRSFE